MSILTVHKANQSEWPSSQCTRPICMTSLTVHKAIQSVWPFSQCTRPINLNGHSHSAQGHSVCLTSLTVHKAIQSVWPFSQCTRPFSLYGHSHSAQGPSCMPILTSYELLVGKSFLETRGWETAGDRGRGGRARWKMAGLPKATQTRMEDFLGQKINTSPVFLCCCF